MSGNQACEQATTAFSCIVTSFTYSSIKNIYIYTPSKKRISYGTWKWSDFLKWWKFIFQIKTLQFLGYVWCSIDFLGSLFSAPQQPPGCGGCGGPCGPGGGPCGPPMGCGGPGGPGGDSDQKNGRVVLGGWFITTLQGTNISPKNGILKMTFLFPRWDMLISWRVFITASLQKTTLPETNSSHLKMDGWKRIVSFWDGSLKWLLLGGPLGTWVSKLHPQRLTWFTWECIPGKRKIISTKPSCSGSMR